ncbi:ABC transporter permease [Chitinolyticbacter albus]|uniref:ABC transporter permease n=1 Tax=Chitinolyticbacter albus TaxID=2961951 RepID=UPI0021091669|nr:ABC transporter permease [Chitinolyticbacter albus]
MSTTISTVALGDDIAALPRARPAPPARRRPPLKLAALWPRVRGWLLAWPVPLAVLALWQLAASYQWIPAQILPAPLTVAATFVDLFNTGELQSNTLISLQRVLFGFLTGAVLGLALGVAMGLSPLVKDYLYPTFKAFAQVPSLGWLPLLMMVVGIDEALKIILIAKSTFVPITLNTYKGLQGVPSSYIEVAKVYGFNRWQMLRRVVLPAAFPPIWNGVRYGLTHSWLALVGVELLASSEGLGFLIVYGRQLYQLDVVLAAVVVVGAVGYALDKILALIEARLLRWRRDAF